MELPEEGKDSCGLVVTLAPKKPCKVLRDIAHPIYHTKNHRGHLVLAND
jgi:hypothetical protein